MVTFLVFSIITAVISAAASITVTLALSYWDIAVDLSDCTTLGGSCYCLDGISYGGMFLKDINRNKAIQEISIMLAAKVRSKGSLRFTKMAKLFMD